MILLMTLRSIFTGNCNEWMVGGGGGAEVDYRSIFYIMFLPENP